MYNGDRIDTATMQSNPRSKFGIVLHNEDDNNTVVKFALRGITPSDEELETLPVYKIRSPLFFDPSRKLHAVN